MIPIVLSALLLAAAAPPASGVKGTYTIGGEALPMQDAVAFRRTDWEGPKVVVLLLEKPVDHAALGRALDIEGRVEAAKNDGSWAELEFREDGTWTKASYSLQRNGGSSSGSKFDSALAATMKARIANGSVGGRVHAAFGEQDGVDLTLSVPIVVPVAGAALPADGGDPARAVLACNAAFAAKKMADVRRWCDAFLGDVIDSSIRMKEEGTATDPWSPGSIGECPVAALTGLALTNGVAAGDEARLDARGAWTKDDQPRTCAGPVFLRRENGAWRLSAARLETVSE
jgi:hypothetical protein